MSADWAGLEGQEVNGVLPLLRLLGSSERSAVFLSRTATNPPSGVALKLVPAIPGRAELLLPRWRSAAALHHPHLLRLFEVGECEVGGQRYLYSVMEYADQNLAGLLEHRALASDEVREMLGPTLNALAFLHGSKLVHGGLKPSNVLVVGEQIKLASDAIRPASDLVNDGGASGGAVPPYQPPEAGSGRVSAAGDVWALGVVTCEALSRRRPAGLHAIAGSIVLPPDIPSTFREMISKCLSRNPEDRPDIARIQAWQKGGEPMPKPTPTPTPVPTPTPMPGRMATPGPISTPVPAPAPGQQADVAAVTRKAALSSSIRLVIRAEIKPQDEITEPTELKAQWRPVRLIVATALLLAVVGAGIYFLAPAETPAEAKGLAAASRVVANAPRPEAPRTQAPATGTQAPATPQAASAQTPSTQAPAAQARLPVPVPPAPASDSPSTINEVIPTVPRSASQTIRGTVRVSVRVAVDQDGKVVTVTSEDPGPSRYFERLSLEAAKKWMFAPGEAGGQRLMLVKFNYTRAGTTAKASPIQ